MGTPNWANLKAKNRVKDIGIPWTSEEQQAIYTLKIPANYVREGILTVEEYKERLELTNSPLFALTRVELKERAKKDGINFTPEVTKSALIKAIETNLARMVKEQDKAVEEEKKPAVQVIAKAKAQKKANKKVEVSKVKVD